MDWIGEIEKHAGALGRPTIFKDAMTTLSFRLEESLKEDVNLLAEYLTRRLESKSSAGAVARAFIASGLEQMRAQYPDLQKFLEQRRIKNHDSIVSELVDLVESARRVSARSVNAVMTATYWEIGRRMVEFEQRGKKRAEYGEALLERLAADLTVRFGRANLA